MTELGELTAAQREEAMRRYAVLEPHLTGGVPLAHGAQIGTVKLSNQAPILVDPRSETSSSRVTDEAGVILGRRQID